MGNLTAIRLPLVRDLHIGGSAALEPHPRIDLVPRLDHNVNIIYIANVIHNSAIPDRARRRAPGSGLEFIPHARRREAKTDAIVRAALQVLATDGIHGLTLQRVAHALGITTTALYRYFSSKDALLAALQRRAIGELHAALGAALAAVEPRTVGQEPAVAALARLLAVVRFHRDLPRTHPDAHRLVTALLGDTRQLIADEHAAATVPLLRGLLVDVRALLEAAAAAGACEPGDAEARTVVLWATLQGLAQLEKLARLAPRTFVTGVERVAIETLLHGFGADRSEIHRAERVLGAERASGGSR